MIVVCPDYLSIDFSFGFQNLKLKSMPESNCGTPLFSMFEERSQSD